MKTLLAACALVTTGCALDKNLGSTNGPMQADASSIDGGTDGSAAAMPLLRTGPRSILFDGDDMIFDGDLDNDSGLRRRSPDGTVDVIAPGVYGYVVADADAYYVATEGPSERVVAVDRITHAVTDLLHDWPDPTSPQAIAADADWIYFSEPHRVARVAKDGSRADVLLAGLDHAHGLAADDDFVYVAEWASGKVLAVRKSDGAAFALVVGLNLPNRLLVVGDWLYVSEEDQHGVTLGRISRVLRPLADAAPEPVTPAILVTGLGAPGAMAVDGGQLYWVGYFSGLQRAPLDGGTAESLLGCHGDLEPPGGPNNPQGCVTLAIHGDLVYLSARDRANNPALYAVPR